MNNSSSGDFSAYRCKHPLAGIWLGYCTWAVLLGWGLSALGCLTEWGYLAGLAIGLATVAVYGRGLATRTCSGQNRRLPIRRFRRLLPALYLTVFAFALLGGILYPPSNYDALSYRLPRMLNWLAEERWNWIHTARHAVNTRGAVSEWIEMPFLLLGGSDRLLFLPNLLSFGFLPGLVFNILIKLGVARRVAWNWMWIFPSGYCFALQAGSIGNDLIGATLFLAAMSFALQARHSRQWSDFALAAIGMALATGVKPSNAPLVLPWVVAIWPAIPVLWRKPARTIPLALVSVMVSFAPNAFLNHKHCGDWTGMAVEPVMMKGDAPWLCASWNIPYLLIQNLTPPVFPVNAAYNRHAKELIPEELKGKLAEYFQPEAACFHASELMMEENGPLGLGILILLAVGSIGGLVVYRKHHHQWSDDSSHRRLLWFIFAGALVALLPMLTRSGLTGSGRYLAAYYLLLMLPLLLGPGTSFFFRSRIWKTAVAICFGALFITMVINPARPLWPALTLLKTMKAAESANPVIHRAWDVYTTYRLRPDAFAPIRNQLPAGIDRIGFIAGNTPESSLWKPFGKRRVIHILPTDSLESIRERGIIFIVAGQRTMKEDGFPELKEWCAETGAEIVASADFPVMIRIGVEPWYLLRIPAAPNTRIPDGANNP